MSEFSSLEDALGYVFRDRTLIRNALTHSSYANESKRSRVICNERLEFLGDSLLGVTVAEHLYRNNPDMPEGVMTRQRAALVCEKTLFSVAERLGLGEHLILGHGEEASGGRTRPSILADAVEALLAAMYLDGGWPPVISFVGRYILSQRDGAEAVGVDNKTTLQELIQRKSGQSLIYHLIEETGPDHDKLFVAEARLNGERIGLGRGRSKKEAEQMAAGAALSGARGR
ncbi:MAG: ribonuclease III [Oscillospiraceae bacterium]|jgi:ribonuclease-3|nr:ribonuclease III [Oscillospiraceae bacterium]